MSRGSRFQSAYLTPAERRAAKRRKVVRVHEELERLAATIDQVSAHIIESDIFKAAEAAGAAQSTVKHLRAALLAVEELAL